VTERKQSADELARRVAMLTAEHSSLQSQRGVVQSEILTRQSLFLTVASAVLVSLGLVGTAIGFNREFLVISVCSLAVVWLLGILTLVRQLNADAEDYVFVIAMNRIRGAYFDLDPSLQEEFLTSHHDDPVGAGRTYNALGGSDLASIAGGAAMFLAIVDSGVLGLLVGAVIGLSGGPLWLSVAIGVVSGIVALVTISAIAGRRYIRGLQVHKPRRPSKA
jgi:hypothetical protein